VHVATGACGSTTTRADGDAIVIASTRGSDPDPTTRRRCEDQVAATSEGARAQHGGGGSRNPAQRGPRSGSATHGTRLSDCSTIRRRDRSRRRPRRGARSGQTRALRRVILLDTNVISALMRRAPNPDSVVVRWLDRQPAESIWTTSITVFEVKTGLHLLPPGQRREDLERAFDALLTDDLNGRIQSFDTAAASAAGEIAAKRRSTGRTLEIRDVQIAGIAVARRAQLATRNTRHFTDLGVVLIDPWSA
jgi:predicted nucleic acid-binding protein